MLIIFRTVGSVYEDIYKQQMVFLGFHTGHDGPSEMIQYFVSKNKRSYQRDILMPQLMHSDSRTISSKTHRRKR